MEQSSKKRKASSDLGQDFERERKQPKHDETRRSLLVSAATDKQNLQNPPLKSQPLETTLANGLPSCQLSTEGHQVYQQLLQKTGFEFSYPILAFRALNHLRPSKDRSGAGHLFALFGDKYADLVVMYDHAPRMIKAQISSVTKDQHLGNANLMNIYHDKGIHELVRKEGANRGPENSNKNEEETIRGTTMESLMLAAYIDGQLDNRDSMLAGLVNMANFMERLAIYPCYKQGCDCRRGQRASGKPWEGTLNVPDLYVPEEVTEQEVADMRLSKRRYGHKSRKSSPTEESQTLSSGPSPASEEAPVAETSPIAESVEDRSIRSTFEVQEASNATGTASVELPNQPVDQDNNSQQLPKSKKPRHRKRKSQRPGAAERQERRQQEQSDHYSGNGLSQTPRTFGPTATTEDAHPESFPSPPVPVAGDTSHRSDVASDNANADVVDEDTTHTEHVLPGAVVSEEHKLILAKLEASVIARSLPGLKMALGKDYADHFRKVILEGCNEATIKELLLLIAVGIEDGGNVSSDGLI